MAGKFYFGSWKKEHVTKKSVWTLLSDSWITLTCVETNDMDKSVDDNETEMDQEPVNPNLPIRQYLDKHIMPSLIEALEKMTNDKPEDPIKYIGEYLLKEEDKL